MPTTPQRVGRYQVLEEIARGGMGVVYRARDPNLGGEVALKVLLDPEPDPRFLLEARAAAALQHPGIVRVSGMEKDEAGRDFMLMEWVEGESLQDRIKRGGPLPLDEAISITLQLCDALGHAHARGVLHRDLKPHNVLLTRAGQAKITDFGLAKIVNQSQSLTQTGEVMGTPAYMPPEQATGNKAAMGPCSDIYSLGATLYALLTGRPPFKAPTMLNVIHAVLGEDPEPPSKHRADVLPGLDAVVLRCLAKEPGDRFGSAGDLAAALRGEAIPTPETAEPVQSGPRLLAAAGIVILGLGGALAVAVAPKTQQRQTSPTATPGQSEVTLAETPGPVAASPAPAVDVQREARAALERGIANNTAGRYAEAAGDFSEAIRLNPGSAAAYGNRGSLRGRLGDSQGALDDCTEAIRLDPDDPVVYLERGIAREKLGDFQGAIDDYNQGIRLRPDFSQAYYGRGVAHAKLSDRRSAIDDYTRAVEIQPGYVGAYVNRGAARGQLGDWQGVIEDFERALELEPNAAWAAEVRDGLQTARQKLARQQAAEPETSPSASADAEAQAAHERGLANFELGHYQEALEDFSQAIELRPDYAEAYSHRALTGEALGDWEGGLEDSKRASQLRPDFADAYFYCGVARARLDDWQGAVEDYTRAIELNPDYAKAYLNRGVALGKLGDWQQADKEFTRAIELKPDGVEAYLNRGIARRSLGDLEGALEDYDRAIELKPDANWAPRVRQWLEENR